MFPSCSDSVIDLTTALPPPHRRRHQFWFFSLYEKPGLLSLQKPSTTELVFGRAGWPWGRQVQCAHLDDGAHGLGRVPGASRPPRSGTGQGHPEPGP